MNFRLNSNNQLSRKLIVPSSRLQHGQLEITLLRKSIRSVRLSISSEGNVKLTVPYGFDEAAAMDFLKSKLPWIEKHLEQIHRQKELEPDDFSTVSFLGQVYPTIISYQTIAPRIYFDASKTMHLVLKPGTPISGIQKVLDAWFQVELKKRIDPLVKEWEPIMGVEVLSVRYRRMKTRWGTCNVLTHQILLNTELARKSFPCIEYILVHEMAHLLERGHGPAFKAVMDNYLPHWRLLRKELNGK
ncbi:MAG: SprT family zinc-dependent metalloprotease [Bacteroidota bacterium]|nr:SprT family zinc-dependent metalloprotease [Bacteroidota bacterium]